MWAPFLSFFLSRLIKQGALIAIYPGGRSIQYGEDSSSPVTVRFHARSLPRKLLVNPDLALGEAYMDGTLTIEDDNLYGLIELLVVNLAHPSDVWHYRWLARLRRLYRRLAQFNPAERARRNVAHHYDLSGALYDLFLDTDRQYSCAYFRRPEDGLEAAQENKKALIAANPDQVAQVKAQAAEGHAKPKALGWFVGQAMKASGGKANPQALNQILKDKLG